MSEVRLIDAEALKRAIKTECNPYGKPTIDFESGKKVLKIIDNAQTVIPENDIFEWCTDCKEYNQEKHCCHRWSSKIRETIEEVKQYKLDEQRPHGEWISTSCKTNLGTFELKNKICDQCKHSTKYKFPFCPWCGADMRGKEE